MSDMRMNDSEIRQWDETTKPGQFWRYPSKGSQGLESKEEKKSEKDEFLSFFLRQKVEGKIQVN
jgi:hypothetical protein